MPCYDGRGEEYRESQRKELLRSKEKNKDDYRCMKELKTQNDWLGSAICALTSELERRGIADDVIAKASRSGLINIMGFWSAHKNDDVTRLSREIHKYSKDKQAVMKKILNEKTV